MTLSKRSRLVDVNTKQVNKRLRNVLDQKLQVLYLSSLSLSRRRRILFESFEVIHSSREHNLISYLRNEIRALVLFLFFVTCLPSGSRYVEGRTKEEL